MYLINIKKGEMKRIILLLLGILLMVEFPACKKDPIDKYTIEASSGLGGVISPSGKIEVTGGTNTVFTLTPDVGFKGDFITVNGIKLSLTDNNYNLLNVTKDYKIEVMFKKDLLFVLTQNPWVKDSVILRELNGSWSRYASTDKDSVIFNPNGRFNIYRKGVLVGDGPWSINETTNPPTLNYGGGWIISILNETFLDIIKDDVIYMYSHH